MEQLNNEAPPQILVPKCGNHNGLPTLHLEYARWSHNSNHIYAKNCLKLVSHPMLNLDHQYKHKGFFYMNINIYFTFVKINIINVHAKFVFEWPTLIGVNTLTWAPNTTKHDHFPLWHSFRIQLSSNCIAHMSMGKYPCWIDVHSYFIADE